MRRRLFNFRDKDERNLVIVLMIVAIGVLGYLAFYKSIKSINYEKVFIDSHPAPIVK